MSEKLEGPYQIWEKIYLKDIDETRFKFLNKNAGYELFQQLVREKIDENKPVELWYVNKDMDGIYNVKTKFKWEKH